MKFGSDRSVESGSFQALPESERKKRLDQRSTKGSHCGKNPGGLPESHILLSGMVRHKRLLDRSNAVAGGRQLLDGMLLFSNLARILAAEGV